MSKDQCLYHVLHVLNTRSYDTLGYLKLNTARKLKPRKRYEHVDDLAHVSLYKYSCALLYLICLLISLS